MALTKLEAQRIHAKRRAYERHGLVLNRQHLREIVTLIQRQKATLVERTSLRVTVWELTYLDIPIRVVYDAKRKTIVTFLPIEQCTLCEGMGFIDGIGSVCPHCNGEGEEPA